MRAGDLVGSETQWHYLEGKGEVSHVSARSSESDSVYAGANLEVGKGEGKEGLTHNESWLNSG